MINKLIELGKIYPQGSKKWLKKRHSIITASDVGTILDCNPYNNRLSLLKSKSLAKPKVFENIMTNWGTKYEPIAKNIYEDFYKEKVYDCGLLIHPEYEWLGASPDGLRESGTMLEIKCLYNRKMLGETPHYYWIQMQIQMEVADLNKCDFFECKFIEFSESDYEKCDSLYKGSDIDSEGNLFYWKLDSMSCKEVVRDKEWFLLNKDKIHSFYKDIQNYKKVGSKKRNGMISEKPSKRIRSNSLSLTYIDWNKWVSATQIYNYMMNDPILDWLNMFGVENGFIQDQVISHNYDFNKYNMELGIKFENAVFDNIKSRFEDKYIEIASIYETFSFEKATETLNAMKEGIPFIIHGVLHNYDDQTYGIPDLLVRADYINKLFTDGNIYDDESIKATKFVGSKNVLHYCVIDIKMKKLSFKKDDKMLKNDNSIRANKGQVIIYNRALGKLQGYEPKWCFLFGKGSLFKKPGIVSMKEDIVNDVDKGIAWIKDLKENGSKMTVYPPSRDELRPNLCNCMDYPWHNAKKEIGKRTSDITELWNCGVKERNNLIEKGIISWKDPKISGASILGNSKKGKLLDLILNTNKLEDDKPYIIINNKEFNKKSLKKKRFVKEFFVDFETVNYIDPQFNNIRKGENEVQHNQIYLIGLGYINSKENWVFESFIVNKLSFEEEDRIVNEWLDRMTVLSGKSENIVYHWTSAEKSWLNNVFKRGTIKDVELNWFDLHKFFIDNKITMNGVMKYSLKSVAKWMFMNGLIKTNWDSNAVDGMGAMMIALNTYKRDDIIDIMEISEMIDVINYNEIDCKVMSDILDVLRKL